MALVEAHGICTGATGRNGGHICRPEAYQIVNTAESWGKEEALRTRRLGIKNRDMMLECIEKQDAVEKVSLRVSGTIVVFETEEEKEKFQ